VTAVLIISQFPSSGKCTGYVGVYRLRGLAVLSSG